MRFSALKIQTQREAPNNARTAGFSWLVRAGFLTREKTVLPLGQRALDRLEELSAAPGFLDSLGLPLAHGQDATYFITDAGPIELIHCSKCGYTAAKALAQFEKVPFSTEAAEPLEKVATPDCATIEELAAFLSIPKERTAKALMYTRVVDEKFVFVVVRGDMALGETKLKNAVGEVRLASAAEIEAAGAVAGYASPVGLKAALIAVDDLIARSPNLVAGANESGFHLLNTNCGRDYSAQITADLVLATHNAPCIKCGSPLVERRGALVATRSDYDFENLLHALAETYHDDKGLTIPFFAAPFAVYLMHVPGKELDTRAAAEEIYKTLRVAGTQVLFDDRDERAGVKFNDADLIGPPLRLTVGEKNLKQGMVELKQRSAKESKLIQIDDLLAEINRQS